MRRLTMILLATLALTSPADACGPLAKLRDAVQARRQARTANACQVATVSQPAPQYRPAAANPPPVLLTGPVVTAVRQCAGGVCPK